MLVTPLNLLLILEIHSNTLDSKNLNLRSYEEFRNSLNEILSLLEISPNEILIELQKLLINLGLEFSMEKVGASSKSARRIIAKEVNLERLKNNPISLSEKNIEDIFNL